MYIRHACFDIPVCYYNHLVYRIIAPCSTPQICSNNAPMMFVGRLLHWILHNHCIITPYYRNTHNTGKTLKMFSLSLVHTSWRLRMLWPPVNYTRWRSNTLTSTGHECREPRRGDSRGGRTNNRTSSRLYLDDENATRGVSIHILQLYMYVWTVVSLHP